MATFSISFRDIRLQKYRDLENRVRGPSRSLKMSPFGRAHTTSYWRSIVLTMTIIYWLWLYLVSFLRCSMSKNIVTFKSGSEATQGHWKWYHSINWCSTVTLSL